MEDNDTDIALIAEQYDNYLLIAILYSPIQNMVHQEGQQYIH